MRRIFVGMPGFERDWARLKIGDDVRILLEQTLLRTPTAGVLIAETGGIRKLRLPIPGKGKSGGIRVFYYDHAASAHTFLMAVILKGELENLSKAERNALRAVVQQMTTSKRKGKP